jgi:lysophospholipase L1-like esterase
VAAGEGTNYGWTYVLNKDKNNGKNGVWNGHWVIGNKNPTWLTDGLGSTNQWCHRSLNGYPNLVAAKLDADLRDTACSGAAAVNGALRHQFSYDSYKDVVPLPQLGSSTGDYDQPNPSYDAFAPDVVTITFGANDIDFATVVSRCYHSAESASFCDRDKGLNDIVTQALKYQKQSLELVISEVIHRGQLAGKTPKIFITTYYDPFPTPGVSCDDIKPKDFAGIRLGLSSGEVKWLKSKLVLLNQNIREVARKHREVAVVSLDDAFTGHQWCSETPWVYGPSIVTQPSYGANASPFHPTVTGQAVISNRVAAAIRKELKS